jgi:alkanesulfonate monooxygenase SsuD/methylene tetrahydromethanopterin reductase-like flavin-dependent oxidoreductase (luciferase family)
MTMTFGMHLGHVGGPMNEMRKLWKFADTAGFDWFSSADHFQESPYRDGNGDCFEAISTMTAIALDTQHVRVGSLVICVNYRNPGVLAKAISTIDHLSGGRCNLGIGAGWHQHEYEGFGIPFERIGVRQDQLEEAVQILRMLFDEPVSRFKGQYFQLNDARCNPKPLQKRLPLWVGGLGEKRTIRTAAKYADGWNGPYIDAAAWKAKNAILDEWCAREGRDPRQVARTVNVGFYLGADAKGSARAETIFKAHWGENPARKGYFRGTAKDALEMCQAYEAVGVQRVNLAFREGPYDFDAIQAFVETVFPAFGIKSPGRR